MKRNGCQEPNCDSKYHHLLHYHKSKPKEERSRTADAVHDIKLKEEQGKGIETATTTVCLLDFGRVLFQ